MAGNGVTTRLQSKKWRDNQERQNIDCKRKPSNEMFDACDEENVNVVSGGVYSSRSFPLDHETDLWHRNSKKVAKTESSAKQRRALCDRGDNNSNHDNAAFTENHKIVEQQLKSDKKGISSFEAMDTESTNFPENTLCIPDTVFDIDSGSDSVTTNTYSKEIMDYLMCIEARDLLKPGSLDNSPEVTPKMRAVLMDWLLQVQNHEELKDETLHLCVALTDSFLSLVDVKMPKLQLVGITCLLIASKFNERFAPEISTLCYLTDNTFGKEQVMQCERVILETLQFQLARPVSITFLESYLQVDHHQIQVEYLARYILDLSINNIHLVSALPSLKASSALYLSRLLLLDTVPAWTPGLAYCTNYKVGELHDSANDLIHLLTRAPDSKFQGARNKYNREEYSYISHCNRVRPEWMIRKNRDESCVKRVRLKNN